MESPICGSMACPCPTGRFVLARGVCCYVMHVLCVWLGVGVGDGDLLLVAVFLRSRHNVSKRGVACYGVAVASMDKDTALARCAAWDSIRKSFLINDQHHQHCAQIPCLSSDSPKVLYQYDTPCNQALCQHTEALYQAQPIEARSLACAVVLTCTVLHVPVHIIRVSSPLSNKPLRHINEPIFPFQSLFRSPAKSITQ